MENLYSYAICWPPPANYVGSRFRLQHPTGGCRDVYFDGEILGHPPVYFDDDTPPDTPTLDLNGHAVVVDESLYPGLDPQSLYMELSLDEEACDYSPPYDLQVVVVTVGEYNGDFYLHDPRHHLYDNTVENPLFNAGGDLVELTKLEDPTNTEQYYEVTCFNAPMTFLNEEHCVLSYEEDTCSFADPGEVLIELTYDAFETIYNETGVVGSPRYVYAVNGLRQDKGSLPYLPPCHPSTRSRWMLVEDCTSPLGVTVDLATNAAIASVLMASKDTNPLLRDVIFPAVDVPCELDDMDKFDFVVFDVQVDGVNTCWLNVHQDHLQVFDFTDWGKSSEYAELLISCCINSSTHPIYAIILQYPYTQEERPKSNSGQSQPSTRTSFV
jgi:hypothetical protein